MSETEGTILQGTTDSVRRAWRVGEYVELTKPRLTMLSVLTTLAGYVIAANGAVDTWTLVHALVGAFIVGGGCGALNMYVEREYDAQMRRTQTRPIPSGRIGATEVLIFGTLLSIVGVVYLALAVNPLTAILGAATIVSYVFLYTPLKRISTLNTLVGGIPGALPPVMGWAAARNDLGPDPGALILFLILFFWQMPHFLALAWMYRRDYQRAGYKMLTIEDTDGSSTSRQILLYTAALLPVSLLPTMAGIGGTVYFFSALALGIFFLALGVMLARQKKNRDARMLFYYSLLYLPILLLILSLDS
jgi:protoheme IX farnesyltransferase